MAEDQEQEQVVQDEPQEEFEEDDGLVCNCNDEYVTEPCPVHSQKKVVEDDFGTDLLVITDADLDPEVYGVYEGFKFICPVCKVPSIMVNRDMGNYCVKCGKKTVIRSRTVTDYVRRVQEKSSNG